MSLMSLICIFVYLYFIVHEYVMHIHLFVYSLLCKLLRNLRERGGGVPDRHVYRILYTPSIYICMYISYYYLYILWYKGLRGVWDTRVSLQDTGERSPLLPQPLS